MPLACFGRLTHIFMGAAVLLLSLFTLISGVEAAPATAILRVLPASGTIAVGDEFSVDFRLDTGGAAVAGIGVVVSYDGTLLQFVSSNAGNPLSVFPVPLIDPNPAQNPFNFERVRFDNGFNGSGGQLMRVVFMSPTAGSGAATI